jgi:ribonuclease-3
MSGASASFYGSAFWQHFPTQQAALESLQQELGYLFRNPSLLYQSLSHKSVMHHFRQRGRSPVDVPYYERLEFLGDSVVSLVISTFLWKRFPLAPEGQLSKLRSHLVSQSSLAQVAHRLSLSQCILVAPAEVKALAHEKESILSDVYEAIMGAVYLDSDLPTVSEVVLRTFSFRLQEELEFAHQDFKTLLQEVIQKKYQRTPVYIQKEEIGPDHEKTFSMAVQVDMQEIALGQGKSKKKASQQAAKAALEKLRNEGVAQS